MEKPTMPPGAVRLLDRVAHKNGIEAAIEAGKEIAAAKVSEYMGMPLLIAPRDFCVTTLEHLLPEPLLTKQRIQVTTAASFIEYFNRFADDNSVIFCDIEKSLFIGVIDYHSETTAEWCAHSVSFICKKTKERQSWESKSGQRMTQTDFAYFIEENLEEIVKPVGAEMLEIATSLRANTNIKFKKGVRLDNGQSELQYVENIDGAAGATGKLQIPETIKLGMRVFEGGDGYEVDARFRYRIREGALSMWYDLVRPHKTHEAAVNDIFEKIKQQAKCQTIIHGAMSGNS